MRDRHLPLHAHARVEEERERDRLRILGEVGDLLDQAVFEDLEVALAEPGDELAGAVLDRDAQENEIGAAVEHLLCGGREDQRGPEAERSGETGHWPAQRVASTRTLGRFISTDSFVGGISDSGRE